MEPKSNKKKGVSKGFIIALTIGIILLTVILYPNFKPHPPPYDSHARAALKSFQTGCVIYWEENDSDTFCDKETAFKQLDLDKPFPPEWWGRISIEGGGTPKAFSATASHEKSERTFKIDEAGNITRISGG